MHLKYIKNNLVEAFNLQKDRDTKLSTQQIVFFFAPSSKWFINAKREREREILMNTGVADISVHTQRECANDGNPCAHEFCKYLGFCYCLSIDIHTNITKHKS